MAQVEEALWGIALDAPYALEGVLEQAPHHESMDLNAEDPLLRLTIEEITQAFETLRPVERRIMVQFYGQGEACESLQDIAASLEKSEGYVKGTKWRAAQALQWSFHHAFDAISREAWRVFCQRHQENSALSQAVRAWCASPVA